jgi:hypothetical protein
MIKQVAFKVTVVLLPGTGNPSTLKYDLTEADALDTQSRLRRPSDLVEIIDEDKTVFFNRSIVRSIVFDRLPKPDETEWTTDDEEENSEPSEPADYSHVPTSLGPAIDILLSRMDEPTKERVRNGQLELPDLHMSVGMSIRNDWGLWHHSPLANWFNSTGIYHADDMSGILLESLQRHIKNEDIDLSGQVKYYQDFWATQGVDVKAQYGPK